MKTFDVETSVGFLLAKAHQSLYRQFRELLTPFGLTPPQFALLAFLWREDGLSQAALSEKTDVDRTTLSGLVDRLQKLDLVKRRPDPADRRACQVCLTAAGRQLEEQLVPLALTLRQRVGSNLASGEYDLLCALLEKIRDGIDD